MKKIRVIMLACLSIVLAAALAACGSNSQQTSTPSDQAKASDQTQTQAQTQEKEPFKLGAIVSASGPASSLGKPEMDTIKMLVDQVNQAGGIDGKKIELYAYDDKSDQNEAVLNMKKLLEQDKVSVVIGGTISGNCLAMIPMAEKAQVPFIALGASKNINIPVKEYVFKTAQGDDIVAPRVVDYLKKNNLTKVAWLSVDNSFGSSGTEEFNKAVAAAGIEVVIADVFEATVNDAKPMLTRVKKENPQAIVIWGTTQESAVVTKNIRELGMDVPIIESHGIGNSQFIELAGDAANGVVFPAGRLLVADQLPDSNQQKKVLVDFNNQFKDVVGYEASTFGGHAWDAFQIVVEAVKASGDDLSKLRDVIENNTKGFVGISGTFTFSADNHNGLESDSLSMLQIQDKTWKIIE